MTKTQTSTTYSLLKEQDYGHEIERVWQLSDNSYVVYNYNYEIIEFTIIHTNYSAYTEEEGWDYNEVGTYADPELSEGEFAEVWSYATEEEAQTKLVALLSASPEERLTALSLNWILWGHNAPYQPYK